MNKIDEIIKDNHPNINFAIDESYISSIVQLLVSKIKGNVSSNRLSGLSNLEKYEVVELIAKEMGVDAHTKSSSISNLYGICGDIVFSISIGQDHRYDTDRGIVVGEKIGTKESFDKDTSIDIYGDPETINDLISGLYKRIQNRFLATHKTVKWAIKDGPSFDYIKMPLKEINTFHPEMYPFIDNVDEMIEEYIVSSSNVLIFTGPPGLGKTSLIAHIINNTKYQAHIVYDKEIMIMERLYSDFIKSSANSKGGLLVLEDADEIMYNTGERNETMSKLLNVSDGLIDTSFSKIIFTANIDNIDKIDQALMRKGRCHKVVEFRHLTLGEAKIAIEAIGGNASDLTMDKEYTVAEIYNGVNKEEKMKMGF